MVQTLLRDFWLFPKLRGCLYETIEEMSEAVTKVIDTVTQEDFLLCERACFLTFVLLSLACFPTLLFHVDLALFHGIQSFSFLISAGFIQFKPFFTSGPSDRRPVPRVAWCLVTLLPAPSFSLCSPHVKNLQWLYNYPDTHTSFRNALLGNPCGISVVFVYLRKQVDVQIFHQRKLRGSSKYLPVPIQHYYIFKWNEKMMKLFTFYFC